MTPRTSTDAPTVACPTCGHDLRGVPADHGLYRCPECGSFTNLRGIVRERRRRRRAWLIVLTAGLLLAFLLLFIAR